METYYALGKLIVCIAVAFQSFLLAIQLWAFKRYRQRCFSLLASGAAIGVAYAVIAGLPYFFGLDMSDLLLIEKFALVLLVCGMSLGSWGMVLLVRSYLIHTQPLSG